MHVMNSYKTLAFAVIATLSLSACGAGDRLATLGKPPPMTRIENPQLRPEYQPVSMPMPEPMVASKQPNSLWNSNRKNFFKDQRAGDVGDILTVLVEIRDEAQLDNETERKRNSVENSELTKLLGFEERLGKILPDGVTPTSMADITGTSTHKGEGTIEREEEIMVRLAAVITQVLPNGNLVISGSQEVLVNFEKRIVRIDGIIRPEDISIDNTIMSEQIAEARIVYGGEGQMTDVQQPRYGQQIYDIIFPF